MTLKQERWEDDMDDPYGIGFAVETVKEEPIQVDSYDDVAIKHEKPPAPLTEECEDPGDGGGKLPPHWGYARTVTGRIYFLNHWTKSTTWTDPRGNWSAPIAAKPCLSFMNKGFCPMGDGCLFRHISRKEFQDSGETLDDPEVESDNFQIIEGVATTTDMDIAPPVYDIEDDDYAEALTKVFEEHDSSEWRFSDGIHDFHPNDPVYIVAEQESLEEYASNQLLRLGEMGTVQQVVPGGHVCLNL